MKTYIKDHQYTITHTETITMAHDWTVRYKPIMDEFKIPEYAAKLIRYNTITDETVLKFTWTTIEKGIT